MHIAKIFAGLVAGMVIATALAAEPDSMTACRWNADGQARLAGCSAIIADKNAATMERAEAYRRRGLLRFSAGASAEAIADLSEAIKLDPRDEHAWSGRGQAKLTVQDAKGAIADLSEAIKLSPTSVTLLITRGHAYLAGEQPREAIKDFDTALSFEPTSVIALNNRGLAYRRMGNAKRAIEDYTAAIHLNPLYALAYNNRGYANEALGNNGDAVADYRRALMIDPAMSGAREGLERLKSSGDLAAENTALRNRGLALSERNCAWCHNVKGSGVSPNPKAPPFRAIQKRHALLALREPLTRGIAAPHDQMPKVTLANEEVDAIIAYIIGIASPK